MDVIEAIKTRRSVREFLKKEVADGDLVKILDCARWAPSGKNKQPWRFIVVKDRMIKREIARHTFYGSVVESAPVSIAVFYDKSRGYDRTKDLQGIGACIQNLLLASHSMGLGAVWIGEILAQREEVERILKVPNYFELMAFIPIGYPTKSKRSSTRIALEEITYKEEYGRKFIMPQFTGKI